MFSHPFDDNGLRFSDMKVIGSKLIIGFVGPSCKVKLFVIGSLYWVY